MSKKLNVLLGSVFCVAIGGAIAAITTSCGPEKNPYLDLVAGKYYSIKNIKEANYMIQYVTANKCDSYSGTTYDWTTDADLNTTALDISASTIGDKGKTIVYWELAYYLAENIKNKNISSVEFTNLQDNPILNCTVETDSTITFHFYNGGTNQVDGNFSYINNNGIANSNIVFEQSITGTQDTNTIYWNSTQLI